MPSFLPWPPTRVLLLASLGVLSAHAQVHAQTTVLQHGQNGVVVQGTRIISGVQFGSTVFGGIDNARAMIGVGAAVSTETQVERGLLRFDLSPYAGKHVAGQGSLELTVFINESFDNKRVSLYTIDRANVAWSPTTSTWNMLNQAGLTPWVGGGGLGGAGQGYGAYRVGAPIASALQPQYTAGYDPADPGGCGGEVVVFYIPRWVLQSWIDEPAANAGLLLRADAENVASRLFFYGTGAGPSGGYGCASDRPKLTFDLSQDSLVPALERVTPAGGVEERYFAAGDARLELALQLFNSYFSHKGQGQRLDEVRGGLDVFLPPLWKRLRHNGAAALMSAFAQNFFNPQVSNRGLIKLFNGPETTARFPGYAAQLLEWFPSNSEYRTRSRELVNATAMYMNQGDALCSVLDLRTFTCAQPNAMVVEYASAAAGVASLDALLQTSVYENWGSKKLRFMWDRRPSTSKPLYAQEYAQSGSRDPENGFTDTDILYAPLVAYAQVAERADTKRAAEMRQVGDYWYQNGWRANYGHFVRKCSFVAPSADCAPPSDQIYTDGMWTPLASLIVNFRISGANAYLDRVYQALQLFIGTPGAHKVPRTIYTQGVAQGDVLGDAHVFVTIALDAYEASGQARFLDLASSYATFLVQHPESLAPVRDSTGIAFLRVMQALGAGVGRLEARFPSNGGRVVVRNATNSVIFDRVIASPVAVVYLPAGTYKVEMTHGGTLRSVTLPVPTDGSTVTFLAAGGSSRITGKVANDANDSGISEDGEPGVSGRSVYIDANSDGTLQGSEASQLTQSGGTYDLMVGAPATIPLRIVADGEWRGPLTIGSLTMHTNGLSVALADLPLTQKKRVLGRVYVNASGAGIPSAIVYLDLNLDGARQPGEPFTRSRGDGSYVLGNLSQAERVRIEAPTAFPHVAAPSSGYYFPMLTSSGQSVSGLDFALF